MRASSDSNRAAGILVARSSPDDSVSHARPIAPLRRVGGASASNVAFDLSCNSDVSVSVPGVTTRTTLRSTGPFAGGGIADLLADRDALTELNQLAEVLLDRYHRYAGHLDRRAR